MSRGTLFAVAIVVWFAVFMFGMVLITVGHRVLGTTIALIQLSAFVGAIAYMVREGINDGTL